MSWIIPSKHCLLISERQSKNGPNPVHLKILTARSLCCALQASLRQRRCFKTRPIDSFHSGQFGLFFIMKFWVVSFQLFENPTSPMCSYPNANAQPSFTSFSTFTLLTESKVAKLLTCSPLTTYTLDLLPTNPPTNKSYHHHLGDPTWSNNFSFSAGTFPSTFKERWHLPQSDSSEKLLSGLPSPVLVKEAWKGCFSQMANANRQLSTCVTTWTLHFIADVKPQLRTVRCLHQCLQPDPN